MEVYSPLQYLASIIRAYIIKNLRKGLNSPPTKQYVDLLVKQHFLNRFVSSGVLLSSFPRQNSFIGLGWTSENAGSTLRYAVLYSAAARSTLDSTLSRYETGCLHTLARLSGPWGRTVE